MFAQISDSILTCISIPNDTASNMWVEVELYFPDECYV